MSSWQEAPRASNGGETASQEGSGAGWCKTLGGFNWLVGNTLRQWVALPCTAEAPTSETVPSKLRAAIRQQSGGAVGLGSEWLAGVGQQSWAARLGGTHSPLAPLSCAMTTTKSTNRSGLTSATSFGIIHNPSIHDNSILQRSKTGRMTTCRLVKGKIRFT